MKLRLFTYKSARCTCRTLNLKHVCEYLFRFEAREAEHPNLIDDVLPVVGRALFFQSRLQLFSHLNDAISHTVDLLQPTSQKHSSLNNVPNLVWKTKEHFGF